MNKRTTILGAMLLAFLPALAQYDYAYQQGKSYLDAPAQAISQPIRFDGKRIVMEKQGNAQGQTTLKYPVSLPEYSGGLFFARDSRQGDHQWPNNTNRLLPWHFRQLADLLAPNYPGIPSNSAPSPLGDALLLQLADGQALFAKAVGGANSLSWFQVDEKGNLSLYVSTLGKDDLQGNLPLLMWEKGRTPYEAVERAYRQLMKDKRISDTKSREKKDRFPAFDYLGWCTWEHYHFNIDEQKILGDIHTIQQSELPIRYVLIDDGHLANQNRQLTSFTPDARKFPNAWEKIMAQKSEDGIKWMGLWYALSGYWGGVSSQNDFPSHIQQTLYPHGNCLLPGKSQENLDAFYDYFVGSLKNFGFDFLKVDNQSFTLPLYMGGEEVVKQAKGCNEALEKATHSQGVGLMNCMAHNVLNTDNTRHSASTRVSIDYTKYNRNMAKSHLFQSYTNTLLLGQTVWPDHDMFHSSDTICGGMMARSKALSGGPVYLSDAPADFLPELVWPLIDREGRLFRPTAPAIPTPESVFTNPLQDGKAYRVFAPTGDEALSLICYNLNVSPAHQQVQTHISPCDFTLRETMTQEVADKKLPSLLLYDWETQKAKELIDAESVELNGFTDRLFHLCPIRKGWAVIGLAEKYLSPATVEIEYRSEKKLRLNVLESGTLVVWNDGKLHKISIKTPGEYTLYADRFHQSGTWNLGQVMDWLIRL